MKKTDFRQTFINGLFLAIPLLAILYIGLKIVRIIEKLITPLAHKVGAQHILGQLTLTIFAIILLLILFFILGILLRVRVMKSLNKQVEEIAYKIMPKLYKLKSLAADDEETNGWKTVLLLDGDSWTPAYIVAKTEQWITAFLPDAPDGKIGRAHV